MARLVVVRESGAAFVRVLVAAWDAGDAVAPLDPRLPAPTAERVLHALRPDDPIEDGAALVVTTSGTTGTPKAVVLDHDAVAASARATSARLGVDPSRHRWLACLPLAHVGGLSVVTRALLTGTPLEVHERVDAGAIDDAAAAGCTHVSLVGTALGRVDTTRWERIVLGGSAPPAGLPANVVVTYGLTETGSGVVYDGVPLDGVEVRVADDGEVLVRGPMVARRHRDGSAVTDAEGWLHTGDAGSVVAGRLTVHGRRGDMIVTGGENVWPDPVERRLEAHPGVAEAAVVGRADPEWGQRVVAVVVPAEPATPPTLADLRAWVRAELPAWCAPRELECAGALPRTPLGKVRRAELRD